MHQLQNGGFNQSASRDFGGYQNSHSGDNRIYTAEDNGAFSSAEFSHHEPAINAQMNSIEFRPIMICKIPVEQCMLHHIPEK